VLLMALSFLTDAPYRDRLKASADALEQLVDLVLQRGAIFVAQTDSGELVGMFAVMAAVHPMAGEMAATEVAFWVDPVYRGTRAWKLLYDAALAWARLWGARSMQMIAPAGSEVGRLYERLGYVELETAFSLRL
jgi:GNAT superfamily N-acetyltransferase